MLEPIIPSSLLLALVRFQEGRADAAAAVLCVAAVCMVFGQHGGKAADYGMAPNRAAHPWESRSPLCGERGILRSTRSAFALS